MFIHPYDPTEDISAKIIITVRPFSSPAHELVFKRNLMILCKPLTLLSGASESC